MPDPNKRNYQSGYHPRLVEARSSLHYALTGNVDGSGGYIGLMTGIGQRVALYLVGESDLRNAEEIALAALQEKVRELKKSKEMNEGALHLLRAQSHQNPEVDFFTFWFVQGGTASNGGQEVKETLQRIVFDLHREVFGN